MHSFKKVEVCVPNFDEIPQSTAEINGRPPYGNSVSGFAFGLIFLIVSFCIDLPNFVNIELPSADL